MEVKQHATEQPMGQIRNPKRNQKHLETNKNGNTTYQNLWDVAKEVLRGKFITINASRKKNDIK